ncbi:hypothetical protein QMM92_20000, partial [Leptospira santarosai]|nr:hypothetical protein [Leptospira santarosai]
ILSGISRRPNSLFIHPILNSEVYVQGGFGTSSYLFGITSPKDKQLLKDFIKSTDTTFIKWAIRSILKWTNDQTSNKVVHLHGDKDKLFPIRTILKPIIIKDGGHFMILDKSEEISIKLNEILKM